MKVKTKDKEASIQGTVDTDSLQLVKLISHGLDTYTLLQDRKGHISLLPGSKEDNEGYFMDDFEREQAVEISEMKLTEEVGKMISRIKKDERG